MMIHHHSYLWSQSGLLSPPSTAPTFQGHLKVKDHAIIQMVRKIKTCWKFVKVCTSGQRVVVVGRNSLTPDELKSPDLYKISIIGLLSARIFMISLFLDVEVPANAGLKDRDLTSHDMAIYILQAIFCSALNLKDWPLKENLQEPVRFSTTVRPICLPKQVLLF